MANHLVGQAVCDNPIDERHQGILPERLWGDGEAEGVRQRAAEEMKDAARAAAKMGIPTVVGFTGSSIWHTVAMFPPVPAEMIERGYQDFADRWNPILDVFDDEGVRFAHEVHPSEIAYDYWTTKRSLEAIGHRPAFGLNFDPSHFMWQDLDPVGFLWDFQDRIYHVHLKESRKQLDGRNGRLGSPAVGRPSPRVGFRLDRPRRRALGEHLLDVELHRIRALDVGGVGRRRDGSTHRRAGSIGVCPQTDPDRAGREGLRRGLLVEELRTTC